MGILRTALIGAAVYGAFKYLTKKNESTGRSVLDDLKDQVPEWMDKVNNYKEEVISKMSYPDNRYSE